jgi:hypothetical protein
VNYPDGQARGFSGTLELQHRLAERTTVRGSYTYNTAYDNSSWTCCTAFAGWTSPRVGIYGPNEIGAAGDTDRAWGLSDYTIAHAFVLTGSTRLPWGTRVSTFFRANSGRPWSVEQSGDLNGDGINFNDRPFIFRPEDLPLAAATEEQREAQRDLYRRHLANNSCVSDHVGQIIPRNSCRNPWFSRLDVRLAQEIPTVRGQRAELQIDLFNVLHGLNPDSWGRYEGVFTTARNLLAPQRYDAATNRILYNVGDTFGQRREFGSNLMLQFQAQIGLRYSF